MIPVIPDYVRRSAQNQAMAILQSKRDGIPYVMRTCPPLIAVTCKQLPACYRVDDALWNRLVDEELSKLYFDGSCLQKMSSRRR